MSHAVEWRCRSESCRTPLCQVRGGVLRPLVPVESVDGRGAARVPCPQCGRVRVWFPTYPSVDRSDQTDRANDGDRCAGEATACRNA